jgi:predicted PurR-regulated permease PerM
VAAGVEESINAVSSSLLGNLASSLVAATVAGLTAWTLGLPFPIVLTGFLDLIPQVGATIAAVVLVAVALTVSTTAAIVMLVCLARLPAARELRRLSARLPARGRAVGVHHESSRS